MLADDCHATTVIFLYYTVPYNPSWPYTAVAVTVPYRRGDSNRWVRLKYGTVRGRILTVRSTAVAVYSTVDSPKHISQVSWEFGICIGFLTVGPWLCTFYSLDLRTLRDHCRTGRATLRSMSGAYCYLHVTVPYPFLVSFTFKLSFLHQFCMYWLEIKTLNSCVCNLGVFHIILFFGWFPRSNNFCSWSMSPNKLKLCMHLPICVF